MAAIRSMHMSIALGHAYLAAEFDSPLTWSGAHAARLAIEAGRDDWHLATVASGDENGILDGLGGGGWFGLIQDPEGAEPDGGWGWVTGEPPSFANWSSFEPNDAFAIEDVGYLYPDGTWNDLPDDFGGLTVALYELDSLRAFDLTGGAAPDSLLGAGEDDRLTGRDGADTIDGGAGDDSLGGGGNEDRLVGGEGADTLRGARGDDLLGGGAGDDLLGGGKGDDELNGQEGNDTLRGNSGDDLLLGGDGADLFLFNNAASGADTIADMDAAAGDLVQLSGGAFADFDIDGDGAIDADDAGASVLFEVQDGVAALTLVLSPDARLTFTAALDTLALPEGAFLFG